MFCLACVVALVEIVCVCSCELGWVAGCVFCWRVCMFERLSVHVIACLVVCWVVVCVCAFLLIMRVLLLCVNSLYFVRMGVHPCVRLFAALIVGMVV